MRKFCLIYLDLLSTFCLFSVFILLSSEIHVNMQVCYIGIHVPWRFAAPIIPSSSLGISTNALPHLTPTPRTVPAVWYSPRCVHVSSLFNSQLWVSICNVWFSVFVLVCWEWWFPAHPCPCKGHELIILFYGCIVLMVYMCYIFFIHSIIDGHLGWFQVCAIVNSAAMNIPVHVSL